MTRRRFMLAFMMPIESKEFAPFRLTETYYQSLLRQITATVTFAVCVTPLEVLETLTVIEPFITWVIALDMNGCVCASPSSRQSGYVRLPAVRVTGLPNGAVLLDTIVVVVLIKPLLEPPPQAHTLPATHSTNPCAKQKFRQF